MKKLLFAICIILLFSQCTTPKLKKTGFEVEVKIIKKLDCHNFDGLKGDFYSVIVNLKNNSDTAINFWIMKCTWYDNFVFNDDSIGVYSYHQCDSNFPVVKQINPGNELTYIDRIAYIGDKNKNKNKKYKMGFILTCRGCYYESLNYLDQPNNLKKNKFKDIIWSNEFTLDN